FETTIPRTTRNPLRVVASGRSLANRTKDFTALTLEFQYKNSTFPIWKTYADCRLPNKSATGTSCCDPPSPAAVGPGRTRKTHPGAAGPPEDLRARTRA